MTRCRRPGRWRSFFRPILERLEHREVPTVYVVNTAADVVAVDGLLSFREALLAANSNTAVNEAAAGQPGPSVDIVRFNLPSDQLTLTPLSPLPDVIDRIHIEGLSQPGATPLPNITVLVSLDGSTAGEGTNGLTLRDHSGSSVTGLSITHFSGHGIVLRGSGGDHDVDLNYIGTDPLGLEDRGNGGVGVLIAGTSTGNRIGSLEIGGGNQISGNFSDGVRIQAPGNVIQGNAIGLNGPGDAALPNGGSGINIESDNNRILGTFDTGARQIISGNQDDGIRIAGSHNLVDGNRVGVNYTATVAIRNVDNGISLLPGSHDNQIGSLSTDGGNIINGNRLNGIQVAGNNNHVLGNLIGLSLDGTTALPNGQHGILVTGDDNQVLGAPEAGAFQFISGNKLDGVRVTGTNNLIQGNFIGKNVGVSSVTGNGGNGITSLRGGNRLLQNTILGNSGLPIDVGGDGPTLNDAADGDGRPNYPLLTATTAGETTTIRGVVYSTPATSVLVEVFMGPEAPPAGFNGREAFIGRVQVTTDANGRATFQVTSNAPVPGVPLMATATTALGTSELSAAFITPEEGVAPEVGAGTWTINLGETEALTLTVVDGYLKRNGADPVTGPLPASGLTELTITGGSGANLIDLRGLRAADLFRLQTLFVNASSGDDVIHGSELPETLLGWLGNDQINGNGGADKIDGGTGNDTITGGAGDDSITGGTGNDILDGGDGADTIRGDTSDTPTLTSCAMCGASQSPINIPADAIPQDLLGSIAYEPTPLKLTSEHVLEDVFDPGLVHNAITIDGIEFDLANIHFHASSEHTLAGKTFAMEAHFVHRTRDGAVAVLGVLIDIGAANPAFQILLDHADQPSSEGVVVDPDAFLPSDHRVYAYSGSLTTPPFTEPLNWFVFAQPITISQAQFDAYRELATAGGYFPNARTAQPLNGRDIGQGNDTIRGGAGMDRIYGGGGDDDFQWQFGDGSDTIDGGDGLDTHHLSGHATVDTVTYDFTLNQIKLDNTVLTFTNTEPIFDSLPARNRIFNGRLAAPEGARFHTGAAGDDGFSRLSSLANPLLYFTEFRNPSDSLTFNTGAGDDVVRYEGLDALGRPAQILIDGGDDTDRLEFGGPAAGSVTYDYTRFVITSDDVSITALGFESVDDRRSAQERTFLVRHGADEILRDDATPDDGVSRLRNRTINVFTDFRNPSGLLRIVGTDSEETLAFVGLDSKDRPATIIIDGGVGDDLFRLDAGPANVVTWDFNDGTVRLDDLVLTIHGMEATRDLVAAGERIFHLRADDNSDTISDDPVPNDGVSRIVIPRAPFDRVDFANALTKLTVNAGTGNDTVTFLGLDAIGATPLVLLNGDAGDDTFLATPGIATTVSVDGGTGNDRLAVSTSEAADGVVTRLNADRRRFAFSNRQPIEFTAVETVAPREENASFVAQLYVDLLGRSAEAAGIRYWTGLLAQGASRADVAQGIVQSTEYRERTLRQLYRDWLRRDADELGLAFWVQMLRQGKSWDEVRAGLLGSDEYFNVHGGNQESFLTALYADVLGRTPDATGQAFFAQALANGAMREQVARIVVQSAEADRRLLNGIYQRLLGRGADEPGLQVFTTALQQSVPEDLVVGIVAASQEYRDRL